MRRSLAALFMPACAFAAFGTACFWAGLATARQTHRAPETTAICNAVAPVVPDDERPTILYAHNLLLRRGNDFPMYIPWIRGEMLRTRRGQVPSFDVPDSFVLRIEKGVARLKLADLQTYLNQSLPASAPFKNVSLQAMNGHLQLHGSVHKLVSLPVELDGTLLPEPNERIRFRMTRLTVLKIPFKGLFHLFGVQLSDLVPKAGYAGVQVVGNDVVFNTQQLLPAPHLLGEITSVSAIGDTLQVVYGDAKVDDVRLAQWHNFLKLTGGTLNFGKLTMRDVDLTMIDASTDPWFDLDLAHYQTQLVYGHTRMTANAGLEVYVPDIDELPTKQVRQGVTLQWLRNRSAQVTKPGTP